MSSFETEYKRLNAAQKRAVDYIEGPLLVIAGPGTGKTQLLATRVANILRKTDMNPSNILCLTFSESGQRAMQERLLQFLGQNAYRVAVHTFHGFGSHIMGLHSDYFMDRFNARPIDDLTRYEVMSQIVARLNNDNPLSAIYQGEYVYLRDIIVRIGQLKQAGLRPQDFRIAVKHDQAWLKKATAQLRHSLGNLTRITPDSMARFYQLLEDLGDVDRSKASGPRLASIVQQELQTAWTASQAGKPQTKPLTAWKARWLSKVGDGQLVFKAARQLDKLAALAEVYQAYEIALSQRQLYDYDDMIMRVAERLRTSPDLRVELQEQYQYILIDEYQDSSGAQVQLLDLLADSVPSEGKPNLMVVGDDDQAIYSFQGAYMSNMLDFQSRWREVETVVLGDNYRSTKPILDLARQLIIQGEDRLENHYPSLSKVLRAHTPGDQPPRLEQFASRVEQYSWLAQAIQAQLKKGTLPTEIAVIAPRHKYLEALVPYLLDKNIPLSYEKRENILNEQHIVELITLARTVVHLSQGEIELANQLLPELLSYDWWEIPPGWLWELHLETHHSHNSQWLGAMQVSSRPKLRALAQWLLIEAKAAARQPLEAALDKLIGPEKRGKSFASPYRAHYFASASLETKQLDYVRLLSSLISLRTHLRQYMPDRALKLADFVTFVELAKSAKLQLLNDHPLVLNPVAVQLLSAHRAKGLEFEQIFIINADQHTWVSERGQINRLSLPPNYPLAPSSDTTDERLRLFYVAATRAKSQLTLTMASHDDQGQVALPLGWLELSAVQNNLVTISPQAHPQQPTTGLVRGLSFDWHSPHFEIKQQPQWRDVLQPRLEQYRLSPTHLTAFLDVVSGGPKTYLVNQMLRFPRALSIDAHFGNAMHAVLRRLHGAVAQRGRLPTKSKALQWLEEEIDNRHLGSVETTKSMRRGQLALDALYEQRRTMFQSTQQAERNFAQENVRLGEVRLTGIVDRLDVDAAAKTLFIVDYKTGKSARKWPPSDTRVTTNNSYDLHRLHRYRQQLLFYKLLIEGSRSLGDNYKVSGAALEYVEPGEDNCLVRLELAYEQAELERLKRLIAVVWSKIMSAQLPDTSHYLPNFEGVKQFEADLLEGKV